MAYEPVISFTDIMQYILRYVFGNNEIIAAIFLVFFYTIIVKMSIPNELALVITLFILVPIIGVTVYMKSVFFGIISILLTLLVLAFATIWRQG